MSLFQFSNRLLYQEYKRRIDVRAVLEHYGAENCTETVGSDNTTEIVHSCLLDRVEPHHRNQDANPSASANVERKLYVCYGYAGMDIFHFIARMERKSNLGQIVSILGEFLAGEESFNFQDELETLLAHELPHGDDLPVYSPKILEPWKGYHSYLAERGITEEAAQLLHLGVNPQEGRVVFPHFFGGKLVGWQARALPGTGYPKYKNSSLFPKNETLYGYDLLRTPTANARSTPITSPLSGSVIVVESPMSVAKAYSLGIPNVVATFGANISKTQINLLKAFDSVVIWMDADNPGFKGERKLIEGLEGHTEVDVVVPEPNKDLADYTSRDEVIAMLDSAVPAWLRLASYAMRGRYA